VQTIIVLATLQSNTTPASGQATYTYLGRHNINYCQQKQTNLTETDDEWGHRHPHQGHSEGKKWVHHRPSS